MKTALSIIAAAVILILSSSGAEARQATCEECRQALAAAEQQLQVAQNYYYSTHTGGSPMMDPNIAALSDAVQQGRDECARLCSAGANQGGGGQSTYGNSGGGNQGGYGASRGVPRGPDPDNPFEDTGGGGGLANDPDNPFEGQDRHVSGKSPNNPFDEPPRSGSSGGGCGPSEDNMKAALLGSKKGGKTTDKDEDKPLTFDTPSCKYFTKPLYEPESNRLNAYEKGSKVCYGNWMYECTEDRGWVARGKCDWYDKFTVKHAEELEKSRFNTKIHLDD